eukprot:scaffold87869_cov20-Tisochrysis_lutea.AAC.2
MERGLVLQTPPIIAKICLDCTEKCCLNLEVCTSLNQRYFYPAASNYPGISIPWFNGAQIQGMR